MIIYQKSHCVKTLWALEQSSLQKSLNINNEVFGKEILWYLILAPSPNISEVLLRRFQNIEMIYRVSRCSLNIFFFKSTSPSISLSFHLRIINQIKCIFLFEMKRSCRHSCLSPKHKSLLLWTAGRMNWQFTLISVGIKELCDSYSCTIVFKVKSTADVVMLLQKSGNCLCLYFESCLNFTLKKLQSLVCIADRRCFGLKNQLEDIALAFGHFLLLTDLENIF